MEDKEYKFTAISGQWVGDKYKYKIKASSKLEATKKFIEFMFGNMDSPDITSEHYNVTRGYYTNYGSGNIMKMNLIARCISGEGSKKDWKELREFCSKKNIKLER